MLLDEVLVGGLVLLVFGNPGLLQLDLRLPCGLMRLAARFLPLLMRSASAARILRPFALALLTWLRFSVGMNMVVGLRSLGIALYLLVEDVVV